MAGSRKRRGVAWRAAWPLLGVQAVVAGCGAPSRQTENQPAVVTVQKIDIVRRLRESGSIAPRSSVVVRSRLGGTVAALAVAEGDLVEKGSVLATLNVEPNEHLRYLSTRVAVLQDSISFALALEERDRRKQLVREGRAAADELDLVAAELDVAQATLELRRTQLRTMEEEGGGAARVRVGAADILAPVSGTVLRRSLEIGEVVRSAFGTPGTSKELFTIGDLGGLVVHCRVDQADVKYVEPGAPVQVAVEALPDACFQGAVERVAVAAIQRPEGNDRVEFEVTIALEASAKRLKPGMTCRIDLVLDEALRVLALPVESVRSSESGGWEVLNRVAESPIAVELGLRDENWVEIKSGLDEGDEVLRYPRAELGPPDLPDPALLGRIGTG